MSSGDLSSVEEMETRGVSGATVAVARTLEDAAVGTWTLVSYISRADDRTIENFGTNALGTASFDRDGRFSIIVVRADLPPFASNNRERGTAAENAAVVRGSIAYFGSYRIDAANDDLIFHIVAATLPNWIGTSQRRHAVMRAEDELTLINAAASGGGVAEITWRRASSAPVRHETFAGKLHPDAGPSSSW